MFWNRFGVYSFKLGFKYASAMWGKKREKDGMAVLGSEGSWIATLWVHW